MSERIALHELKWELAGFEAGKGASDATGDWFTTPFPATVRQAHLAVNRPLPEKWDEMEWWYNCTFARPGGKDRVLRLAVGGADYRAITYLNGEPLGDHKGAYGPAWYDISNLLLDSNILAICVKPVAEAVERTMSPSRHPLRWKTGGEIDYNDAGVWDDILIAVSGPVYFEGWLAHGESQGDHGDLSLRLDINNTRHTAQGVVRIRIEGAGLTPVEQAFPVELASGLAQQEFSLTVPGARSWYPHGLGEPVLYTIHAELALGGGVVDSFEQQVGFRTVKLNRTGNEDQVWRISVNGRQLPIRGINWAGLPLSPGQSLENHVQSLVNAGVNAIRVWGGRHRSSFYQACDKLGVLVLQEFPFGLFDGQRFPREAPDFPQAREIPKIARADSNSFARHLRNHPSIFAWVGGTRLHNQDNAHIMRTVEDALRQQDGTRPYIPVLPNPGSVLDQSVLNAGLSPEHLEDGPPLLIAQGLPAWPQGKTPPPGLSSRWQKYGGESASTRAIAWAAGGQRYNDTAGGFIGEVIDWHPDGGFGVFDFNGKPRQGLEVLAGLYGGVAAGLSFDWKAYKSGTFSAEVWGARDDAGTQLSATVKITDGSGKLVSSENVKGGLEKGKGVIGEVSFALQGTPPFLATVEPEGGKPVPYPLDAAKPPSSYSLAEISGTRLRLANTTARMRFVRDFGIYGLLPVEYILRGILALRVTLGM